MDTSISTSTKHSNNSLSLGVIIIFAIVTISFLAALFHSNYTKEIFSARTEQIK